jgi:hypothetical protein
MGSNRASRAGRGWTRLTLDMIDNSSGPLCSDVVISLTNRFISPSSFFIKNVGCKKFLWSEANDITLQKMADTTTAAGKDIYVRYYVGHHGQHGAEFLEFEYANGRLRYANNSK